SPRCGCRRGVKQDQGQAVDDRSNQKPMMSGASASLFASSLSARLGLALALGTGLILMLNWVIR
ncbi:MAG: hypothetical protein ACR2RE_20740, partial [Geminicoccaceae bacterium]